MPGLVDAHNHLALTYKPVPENNIYYYTYVQESTALRAIQAASNGIQMLASGFTIVRDMGNNAQLRRHGAAPGDRAGLDSRARRSSTPGSSSAAWAGSSSRRPRWRRTTTSSIPEYLDADTPDEIVKAIRQNMLFGAKVIKICVDCKPYGYTADEIRLVIREAAKVGHEGRRPRADACDGARNAIEAGIWSIAHSGALDRRDAQADGAEGHLARRHRDADRARRAIRCRRRRTSARVAGLKNAYDNKVPLTFSTDADYWVAGQDARRGVPRVHRRRGRTPAFRTPTSCAR